MQWKYKFISGVPCHVVEIGVTVYHVYLSLAGKYVLDIFDDGKFTGREYHEDLGSAKVCDE